MSFDVNPVKSTACEMILGCTESSGVTIVVAAALVVGIPVGIATGVGTSAGADDDQSIKIICCV